MRQSKRLRRKSCARSCARRGVGGHRLIVLYQQNGKCKKNQFEENIKIFIASTVGMKDIAVEDVWSGTAMKTLKNNNLVRIEFNEGCCCCCFYYFYYYCYCFVIINIFIIIDILIFIIIINIILLLFLL
jgi:hypothetical protein